MKVSSLLLVFSLSITCFQVSAYAAVDADQIRNNVSKFLAKHTAEVANHYSANTQIKYQLGSIDPRISMVDCPQPLTTELKSLQSVGKINIRVSCQKTAIWSLYVPAEISLYQPIVVAVAPVAKGITLLAHHLQLRNKDTGKLSGSYFTSTDKVIGMETKRPLRADGPIIANYLQMPIVINKGDAVSISAKTHGLTVKMPGIAQSNGRHGEQIRVRNNQSRKIVDAKVTAPGQVIVMM